MGEKKHESTRYSIAIFLFIIGIAAVAVLTVLGFRNFSSNVVPACGLLVLASLVGMLIAFIRAKRKADAQTEDSRRHPYASVDKKQIDHIFDMIADEEKKRRRLDAFAAGVELKDIREAQEADDNADNGAGAEVPAEDTDDDVTEDIPLIIIDDERSEDKPAESKSEPEKAPEEEKSVSDNESQNTKGGKEMNEHDERKPKKRRPEGQRRRPVDPYYDPYYPEPVYYNEYGEPVRRRPQPYDPYYDPYYDDYGDPRRDPRDPYQRGYRGRDPYAQRVLYNEYGEPVRRRPPDDYADPRRPRRRRPDDADRRRPGDRRDPASEKAASEKASPEKAVPEKAAEKPKAPVYDEDDERMPVIMIDDDDNDDRAPAKAPAPASKQTHRSAPIEDEDDEPIIVRSRFEDDDDDNFRRRPRLDEEEVDEGVVILPHDEGYDSYIESKKAKRLKEERKAKGLTMLLIKGIRRKRIRRKSRRYKNFRASVHPLGDYLNSYSAKTGRK